VTSRSVYSLGHSTRTIDEFLNILRKYDIDDIADIRTIPKSRTNPQFNLEDLAVALNAQGKKYHHLKSLGGLRRPQKDSLNNGWRNDSFRGYADYMQTPDFEQGLQELIKLAGSSIVGMMCAEAVPWRCHRSLVGDALLARGFEVVEILDETHFRKHALTRFAKIEGLKITYPLEELQTTI
jgi:uncharacterized protein (DUF488 family)